MIGTSILSNVINTQFIIEIVSSIAAVPKNSIHKNTKFSDIPAWDSLSWLQLDLELNRRAGFGMLIEHIDSINSIHDLNQVMINE